MYTAISNKYSKTCTFSAPFIHHIEFLKNPLDERGHSLWPAFVLRPTRIPCTSLFLFVTSCHIIISFNKQILQFPVKVNGNIKLEPRSSVRCHLRPTVVAKWSYPPKDLSDFNSHFKPWSNYRTKSDPTSNIVGSECWDSGKTLSNIARRNKLPGT